MLDALSRGDHDGLAVLCDQVADARSSLVLGTSPAIKDVVTRELVPLVSDDALVALFEAVMTGECSLVTEAELVFALVKGRRVLLTARLYEECGWRPSDAEKQHVLLALSRMTILSPVTRGYRRWLVSSGIAYEYELPELL
jgi:hypothetical protein